MFLPILLITGLAVGFAAARDEKAYKIFVDNGDNQAQFAASIIGACENTTTYAIICTSGRPLNDACSGGATTITITEGPSTYIATSQAVVSETSATIIESCALDPVASSASCSQTIVQNGYGRNNGATNVYNLTGQYYYQYEVTATAGVHKLDSAKKNAKTCKAASSKSDAVSTTIRGTVVMGVVVLSILGMAIML